MQISPCGVCLRQHCERRTEGTLVRLSVKLYSDRSNELIQICEPLFVLLNSSTLNILQECDPDNSHTRVEMFGPTSFSLDTKADLQRCVKISIQDNRGIYFTIIWP